MKVLCFLLLMLLSCSSREPGEIYQVVEKYKLVRLPSTVFKMQVPESWDINFESGKRSRNKAFFLDRLLSSKYIDNIRGEQKLSSGTIVITDISPTDYLETLKKNLEIFPRLPITEKERLDIISQVPSAIDKTFTIIIDKNKFYKFRYFLTYDEVSKKTIVLIINSFSNDISNELLVKRVFERMKNSLVKDS